MAGGDGRALGDARGGGARREYGRDVRDGRHDERASDTGAGGCVGRDPMSDKETPRGHEKNKIFLSLHPFQDTFQVDCIDSNA